MTGKPIGRLVQDAVDLGDVVKEMLPVLDSNTDAQPRKLAALIAKARELV